MGTAVAGSQGRLARPLDQGLLALAGGFSRSVAPTWEGNSPDCHANRFRIWARRVHPDRAVVSMLASWAKPLGGLGLHRAGPAAVRPARLVPRLDTKVGWGSLAQADFTFRHGGNPAFRKSSEDRHMIAFVPTYNR